MNRETRKVNLKKLQLATNSESGGTTRKTRSFETAKATISKYFSTPNLQSNTNEDDRVENSAVNICQNQNSGQCEQPSRGLINKNDTKVLSPEVPSVQTTATETTKLERAKRTKLTSFVFKNSKDIPEHIVAPKEINSDDFETPEKKIKRAPKLKITTKTSKPKLRPKRQPNIKTAFLRNEQIFSEIAAQHCVAENFSPDEIQLALAISKSEAETSGVLCLDSDEEDMVVDVLRYDGTHANKVTLDIRSKLQKYGFRTAARKDYKTIAATFLPGANRRLKSKWANKFTALTLRNPELQKKKLNEKIKTLLQQIVIYPAAESPLKKYELISSTLKKNQALQGQNIVGYAENVSIVELENYYVTDLFKISHVKAGHLLKDWTAIQGRDLSPKLQSSQYKMMHEKLKKVYTDLEHLYYEEKHKAEERSHMKTDDRIQTNTPTSMESSISNVEMEDAHRNAIHQNSSDHNELDKLLELIDEMPENSTKIDSVCNNGIALPISLKKSLKEPIDKKLKLETSDTQSDLSARRTRASSPDIFAGTDTDSEMEEVEKNNSAKTNQLGITTYEIYSSDEANIATEEVQNVSMIKNIGEKDINIQTTSPQITSLNDDIFQKLCKKYLVSPKKSDENNRKSFSMTQFDEPQCSNVSKISCTQIILNEDVSNIFKTPTKIIYNKSPLKRSKSNSFTLIADDFNSSFKHSEDSIDLTQDEVDDNENECLMLSDDEINYSIRQADKSTKAGKETANEVQNLTLSSGSESYTVGNYAKTKENCDIFVNDFFDAPNQEDIDIDHEFTILDLVDDNKSTRPSLSKTASTLSLDGYVEPIFSQFLTNGSPPPFTLNVSNLSREREEFGILDNYSEPYTQTLFQKTPPPAKSACFSDASLLSSPSENAEFIKRYSSENTQKFNDLLKTTVQPPEETDDYDEFDQIIYGSPPKRNTLQQNEPTGLEKLLTAEISFRLEDEEHYSSPKKLFITPSKVRKQNTPTKSSPEAENSKELPEQHVINGKIYKVRLTTKPKPDFTHQTEAELLRQLYKYGIKPLKRKQAVKILEYIYNQSHPIIVQEEAEEQSDQDEDDTASQSNKEITPAAIDKHENKLNLQDCTGDVLLRFSQELFMEADNEEYVFQTNVSKKISQPLLPFHIAWYNLVCSSVALHETILMYEPIDLQEIYLFLKSLGYRYEPKDLKTFFDRRCIIFRYDLAAPGKQAERHIRKNNKKTLNFST